jgi:hypothetical protein
MLDYILSLKPQEKIENNLNLRIKKYRLPKNQKPGLELRLEGVHPSYDLHTIRKQNFNRGLEDWHFFRMDVYW